jgi:hypothetical protein
MQTYDLDSGVSLTLLSKAWIDGAVVACIVHQSGGLQTILSTYHHCECRRSSYGAGFECIGGKQRCLMAL